MRLTPLFAFTLCLAVSQTALPRTGHYEKIVRKAEQKTNEGNYEEAQSLFESLLTDFPDDPLIFNKLAQVHYWNGDYGAAVKTYKKVLAKNGDDLDALIGLAKAHLAMGDEKKSEYYFRLVLKKDPGNKEARAALPEIRRDTKLRVLGGVIQEDLDYAGQSIMEYQKLSVEVENRFGAFLNSRYQQKFDQQGFDTQIGGHLYPFRDTRLDLGLSFAPTVALFPRQSYRVGLAQRVYFLTPSFHYHFMDYTQANIHSFTGALELRPLTWLKLKGGGEFQRLNASGGEQDFLEGFARGEIQTPVDWLSLYGVYRRTDRGFEAGRRPNPFVRFDGHIAGGGIFIETKSNYALRFEILGDNRNNGELGMGYDFSFGYSF